jgi:hypothetical protein
VWFLTALRIGPHYRMGYTGGDPRHCPDTVCLSTPDGSRSEIALAPNADDTHTVRQTGHLRLWSHLKAPTNYGMQPVAPAGPALASPSPPTPKPSTSTNPPTPSPS